MVNGDSHEGVISDLNAEGAVVRLDIGGFSDRLELVYFDQPTLRRLAGNSEWRRYVSPYLDLAEPTIEPPRIRIRPVDRLELPDRNASFFSTLATPMGLFFLLLFYGGALWVAYEVAVFTRHPAAMVCGISILFPLITPLIFFFLEPPHRATADAEEMEAAPPPEAEPAAAEQFAEMKHAGISSRTPSKLGLKSSAGGGEAQAASLGFSRDDTKFNRTFFEQNFAPFFLTIPPPAIKNMVMEFKGAKGTMVAKRITRISPNEIRFQLLSGQKEMGMRFGEIIEVRQRDRNEQ